MQAVEINAEGTDNVFQAAIDVRVKRAVCLSAYEAAYQIDAMNTSKAMMEHKV